MLDQAGESPHCIGIVHGVIRVFTIINNRHIAGSPARGCSTSGLPELVDRMWHTYRTSVYYDIWTCFQSASTAHIDCMITKCDVLAELPRYSFWLWPAV